MVQALVLEKQARTDPARHRRWTTTLGPRDVRIRTATVGVCGSDVHYYTHGKIGPFVVTEPMVLGHEAAGTIVAVGAEVTNHQGRRRPGLHGAGHSRS